MSEQEKSAARAAWDAKIEAKRERYAARAEAAKRESDAAFTRERQIGSAIPMGQPILISHHSEKRHRRDLARMDGLMRKGIEANQKAAHYADRAESYGTHGISSDDPSATSKLTEKLAGLEKDREAMKSANAAARRAGTMAPYAAYQLSNLGARIRDAKARIAQLERADATPEHEPVARNGVRLEEDKATNRVCLFFPGKPDAETRERLKRAGFRWAPSVGAWQRHRTESAWRIALEFLGAEPI